MIYIIVGMLKSPVKCCDCTKTQGIIVVAPSYKVRNDSEEVLFTLLEAEVIAMNNIKGMKSMLWLACLGLP